MSMSATPNWWDVILQQLNFSPLLSFTPTYEPTQYVTTTMGDGTTVTVPINSFYLATLATAQWLQKQYCPLGKILSIPFYGAGGPNATPAMMYELQWPNGVVIVAGLLAECYTNNPDPTDADAAVKAIIQERGAA
jgi:hypothetical protein